MAPAGEQDDRDCGRNGFDGGGYRSSVHVRHSQIGDHDREGLGCFFGGDERIDAGLSALGGDNGMTVLAQCCLQGLEQHRIVVDQQNPQTRR